MDGVNALQILDTDGDGIADSVDLDDDNDGIPDTEEYGIVTNPNDDADSDLIPNYLDTDFAGPDSDGNGVPDAYDFDGDGIPNHLDLDSDNDGILDNREFQTSGGYTAPTGSVGTNGWYDIYETSPDSGVAANSPVNTDSSGNPDYLDIDADDDGIPDNVEAQSTLGYVTPTGDVGKNGLDSAYENVDTYAAASITPVNTDLTDEPDYRDDDSDNDGTTDINENGEGNVLSGSDLDGDGLDNNFDADNVNYDVNDNIDNPQSDLPDIDGDVATGGDVDYRDDVTGLDSDGDGIPDTVDIDDDNDGILDTEECINSTVPDTPISGIVASSGLSSGDFPLINDTDLTANNGVRINRVGEFMVLDLGSVVPAGTTIRSHLWVNNTTNKELRYAELTSATQDLGGGTNAQTIDQSAISGVTVFDYVLSTDTQYLQIEMTVRQNGRFEVVEVTVLGYSACVDGDTDGDGIVDRLDIDSDNDGIVDNYEAQSTAGYVAKTGLDDDNDGLDNAYDDTPTGGAAGSDGINPTEWINTDGGLTNSDTIPDFRDIDSDNDGIPDNIEAQGSTTYMAPNGVPGANGLDSAYDFNDSFSNTGLSTTLVNTDGDAEPDYRDTDSDGDGTDDDAEGLTGTPTFSGIDTDGDGLDDAFENGSTNDGFVVNDGNSNPSASGFIDVDADVNTGGDLDYRDTLVGQDTDGDGIVDSVDIDDDNDGILDTVEDAFGGTTCSGNEQEIVGVTTQLLTVGQISTLYDDIVDGQQNFYFQNNQSYPGSFTEIFNITFNESLVVTELIVELDRTNSFIETGVQYRVEGFDGSTYTDLTGTITAADSNAPGNQEVFDLSSNTNSYIGYRILWVGGGQVGWDPWIEEILFTANPCVPGGPDFDGDGIINSLDMDSDGDGILDNVEAQLTSGYTAPSGNDTDNDGLDDAYDATPSGGASGSNGISPVNTDSASEAVSRDDYLDIDSDNDGIPDNVEAQTTVGYTAPTGNVGLNGVDSVYELNDSFTATALDPVNFDGTDDDDYRDTDSDNDGTDDDAESGITSNGAGTADSDGDGLLDTWEGSDATAGEAFDANDEINDPVNDLLDEDGDGGTTGDVDYRDTASVPDSDGDGITDDIDVDDDNDGILDTVEDAAGDADFDGIPNRLDIDSDDDGIPDNIEAQLTSSYISPSGSGAGITDANGNGLDDNYETAQGGTDITPVNTDQITGNNADALPDYLDTDTDGDGVLDINENGNANSLSGTDTDGDGLDDAFEGVLNDNDVNDDIDDPTTDLPDLDSDVNTPDGAQPDAAEYNDVDYRDIDDDRTPPSFTGNILWLRADIGVTGDADVSQWDDQSGSGFIANSPGGGNDPDLVPDGVNFNPSIAFLDADDDYFEITNGILGNSVYDNIWIYAVSESNSATNDSFLVDHLISGGSIELEIPDGGGSDARFSTTTGTAVDVDWGSAANTYNIWTAGSSTGTATPAGTNKAVYRDGLLIGSNTAGGGQFTANNSNLFIGSDGGGGTALDGSIAEILIYTDVPSAARQQQLQSYLAIKYGITLNQTDNDATIDEGDYVLQDLSTIVWNESDNSTYHNDVAGIGRDDAMLLNQKQSRSINTSSAVTIGLGSITDTNANNGNNINSDKSFLMWGHNGVAVTNGNTSGTSLLCETELQLDRVWKIVETGSVGSVEVAIPSTTLLDNALTTPTTEVIVFKVADDANFTTNVKHIPVSTRTVNGTASYVVDFDFNGTKYFTYSEVLGIFWNGDSNAWTGGAGTAGAPADDGTGDGIDGGKVLVIDAETSGTNAVLAASANVECLWVKPNSKLVVNDNQFIEFNQDFILEGEIRLIGDAQLWQSHAGLSNVQGNGVIYRDQEASVPSVYRYHYWSSPVTAALGNTSYSTSTVMFDGTTPTSENSTLKAINWQSFVWPNISTLNGAPTDPITIATWWIYSYFNGATRDDWVQRLETGQTPVAEGFIMKSTGRAPQNFTFSGSPNDGTYTKVLTPNTTSLLGNPYPSVIDTQQFISDNSAVIDGTLYFWEHQGESTTTSFVEGHGEFGYIGGYSQRNEAMGVAANTVTDETAGLGQGTYTAPPQYIAVGQGFFVSVPADKGGTLNFENSQRFASTNNFFFRNDEVVLDSLPNFKLGMDYYNNNDIEVHRQLGVNFKKGNTYEYESGFDSRTFDLNVTDAYWKFPEEDSNLVIAGVDEISSDLQIPLGLVIDTELPVKIMIDETNKLEGYTIYLADLVTGRIYNLTDAPIELDLPKGSYDSRFLILFGGQALSNDDNPLFQDFMVYMNNTTDQIVIRNNNNSNIKKVELFNILGQRVNTWNNIDATKSQHQLDVFVPSALYVVKVTTERGEITKKIVID